MSYSPVIDVSAFLKPGQEDLIGKNVLDCHPEPAHSLLADMLQNPRTNVYTIEKKGGKKLIYQTPWYVEGEFMGFMELSMEIPFEMKHRVRGGKYELPESNGVMVAEGVIIYGEE